MSSEPECKCDTQVGGGINHTPNCAWIVWKYNIEKGLHDLPVDRLVYNGPPSKRIYNMAVLIESIRQNGCLGALTVRSLNNGYYEILDGLLRFKAAVEIGITNLVCDVHNLTDAQVKQYWNSK